LLGVILIATEGFPEKDREELNLQSQPQSGKDNNTSMAGTAAKSNPEASSTGYAGKSMGDSESLDSEDRNEGWLKVGGSGFKKDGNAKKS
jgi:hypothetical protein